MRFVDEYRGEAEAARLLAALARHHPPWTLMEVCGGQTHTLIRSITRMLPAGITSCLARLSVCVTSLES